MSYIESARSEGARLIYGGGGRPIRARQGSLHRAHSVCRREADNENCTREIFGPVVSVFKWNDEAAMLAQVNSVEYGLTASIWTNDLVTAHRTAAAVEAGFVWINDVSKHFLGAPFGGYKQSGIGREECIEELMAFTQEKNIHVNLTPAKKS